MPREIKLNKLSNPEEWAVYKGTASRDVIFATMAYKDIASEDEKREFDELATQVPEGYQMIFFTDHMDDTNKHEFRAVVFINHETNEVVVASSGTRFGMHAEGISDMVSDAFLAMEEKPPKLESMRETNRAILDSLGEEAGKYKFHYTGHSLGAFMADAGAADMAIQMRKRKIRQSNGKKPDISSMTFENPGAKKVIEKMYEEEGLDPAEYSKDVDYRGMNNRKNVVNQGGAHAGKMWEVIPDTMEDLTLFQVFVIHASHLLEDFAPVCARLLETCAFGTAEQQLDAHKLTHFRDVLCKNASEPGKETGATVRDADEVDRSAFHASSVISQCKSFLYDVGIFKRVDAMRVENGRVGSPEYASVTPDGVRTISGTELKKALREKQAVKEAEVKPQIGSRLPLPTAEEVLSIGVARGI